MKLERKKLFFTTRELEALVSNIPGGMFHYYIEDQIRVDFISEGMLAILNCTEEQFYSYYKGDISRIIHPDDRNLLIPKEGIHSLREGKSERIEYRIITYDQKIKWLVAKRELLWSEHGLLEAFVVVQDVTDVHRIRQEFEDIANSIPGGVARVKLDRELHIMYLTEGFCQLSGRTMEEFREEIGDEIVKVLCPEDIPMVYQEAERQKGSPSLTAELRIIRKDKSIAWIHVAAKQIPGTEDIYQGVFIDITERKQMEQELLYEKERYRIILDCMDDVTYEYHIREDRMVFTYRGCTSGMPQHSIVERFLERLWVESFVAEEHQELLRVFLQGKISAKPRELLISRPFGIGREHFWHELRGVIVRDRAGMPVQNVGVLRDIDAQKQETLRLRYMSERDSLTRLYNKAATYANIVNYLERDGENRMNAMLMVDFDNFKDVNDHLGHPYGDAVLSSLSAGMKRLFRGSDVLGRVGGDEFVVFMKDLVDDSIVREKACALCALFRNLFPGNEENLSASIGIALYPQDGKTCEELLEKADLALYEAKHQGKNQFQFYTPALQLDTRLKTIGEGRREEGDTDFFGDSASFGLIQASITLVSQGTERKESIESVLELLGRHCGVSRVALEVENFSCVWNARSLSELPLCQAEAGWNEVPEQLVKGELAYLHKDEELRREYPDVFAVMECRRSESAVICFVRQGGKPWGNLSMDDCEEERLWTKRETELLKTVAGLLAAYLAPAVGKE